MNYFHTPPPRRGTPSNLEGEYLLPGYLTVHIYSVYKLKLENLRHLRNLYAIKNSNKKLLP